MIEQQPTIAVDVDSLLMQTEKLFKEGYRLVQIGCTRLEDGAEINYSFDKNYSFKNLRITIPTLNTEVPSISSIYLCAFLYENEIFDLYGIPITGIAVDYKGGFYKTAVKFPFGQTKIQKKT